jgi:hypothetical protein
MILIEVHIEAMPIAIKDKFHLSSEVGRILIRSDKKLILLNRDYILIFTSQYW